MKKWLGRKRRRMSHSLAIVTKIGHKNDFAKLKLAPIWEKEIERKPLDEYKWNSQGRSVSKSKLFSRWWDPTNLINKFERGWEPWSSGYGRLLMYKRSWVRIPKPYTGWSLHFFTLICCKIVFLFEKTKKKRKRGRGWHIWKIKF